MNKPLNENQLSKLIDSYKNEELPVLITLTKAQSSKNYLLQEVLNRIRQELGDGIIYEGIDGMSSSIIREELKIKKHPIHLLIKDGGLQAIYSGMIGAQPIIKSLNELRIKKKSA